MNNELNEKLGLVKKENHQWERLVNIIADYLFDVNGLINDYDMIKDDPEITLDMIMQFYKSKYNTFKIPVNIIPVWLSDFKLILKKPEGKYYGGYILPGVEHYKDDKIDTEIYIVFDINEHYNINTICNTLTHEFRHLYTQWLQHKYNFKIKSEQHQRLYTQFQNIVSQIPQSERKDSNMYKLALLVYFLSPDELNAYMQTYEREARLLIHNNIQTIYTVGHKLEKDGTMDVSSDLLKDYTPYNCQSYVIYDNNKNFIMDFIQELTDETISRDELADIVFNYNLRDMINTYMMNTDSETLNKTLDWNINLIYMQDDVNDDTYIRSYIELSKFLKLFLHKILKEYDKVLRNMDTLYIQLLKKEISEYKKSRK